MRFGRHAGSLSFDFRPDLSDPSLNPRKFDIDPSTLGVDLGSEDSDDVLAGYFADFLFSGTG